MRLMEACNFALSTKVMSNKYYSYFHIATDDKDSIIVNKVSMHLLLMSSLRWWAPSRCPHPQSPLLLSHPCCRSTMTLNLHTRCHCLQHGHLPCLHLPMPHCWHCWYPLAVILHRFSWALRSITGGRRFPSTLLCCISCWLLSFLPSRKSSSSTCRCHPTCLCAVLLLPLPLL